MPRSTSSPQPPRDESGRCMELETLAPTPKPAPAPAPPAMHRAATSLPACAPDPTSSSVPGPGPGPVPGPGPGPGPGPVPARTLRPTGHLETLFDVETYVTRGTATSNSTIVLLTDDFGLNLVSNRLLADQYAARTGLRVLVPNLLPGGGLPLSTARLARQLAAPVRWYNLAGHARRAWAALKVTATLAAFSLDARRSFPRVLRYVRAVRASLPLGSKLGIAGFCLGGRWSSRLCAEHATEGGGPPLVGAHFSAHHHHHHHHHHPSDVDAAELARLAQVFRVPQSLALRAGGAAPPTDQARELESSLRLVYRDCPERLEVRIYGGCGRGCGRGFALRAGPGTDDEGGEGADAALEQAVAWFRRWLV